MGNINRMVDIVVLLILTGLSVSDIRNKKMKTYRLKQKMTLNREM